MKTENKKLGMHRALIITWVRKYFFVQARISWIDKH